MRENTLTELQGTSILTKEFFNRLIRRIESTKPIAGAGISVKEVDGGFQISGGVAGFNEVTLNVCSNGEPSTITILAKS
jgi:hypothetical protein